MERNALLPVLVFLALSTAAQASAITADADVLRLNYQRPKAIKATAPAGPDRRTVLPTPKGDTTASTKLGHR
jgi:hypothetical protein